MVGVLLLNLDGIASKMPLCLAKSRDALLRQQSQIYDSVHHSALLWDLWERWLATTADKPQINR